jgi:hypothetical protein
VALDVGGSYSIARGIDVTGGVRYRVSRDRIEPLARDERRDSQAVYIGPPSASDDSLGPGVDPAHP